jgi:lipoprotein-anchoring transpeptidase ErfK/SrfK
VHGYPDVPPYPASHGCSRIPMWIAQTVYRLMPEGSAVYVYAS